MSEIIKFDYEGQHISFEFADGNRMINATEMARPFAKRVNNFLRMEGTKEYILVLESRYADSRNGEKREVLRVVQGGTPELQGTWMDEKLALKFAAWLSPYFELWVYDRIEELLLTGRTEILGFQPGNVIKGLKMVVEQLEQQEQLNEKVQEQLHKTAQRLDELESKIISVDEHYYTIAGYCNLKKFPVPCTWPKNGAKLQLPLAVKKHPYWHCTR